MGVIKDFISLVDGLPWPAVLAVMALLAFLESAALLGLVLPGESTVVAGAAVAATAGGSVLVFTPVVAAAVVAGELVSFGLGRRWSDRLRGSALGRRVGPARWSRAEHVVARYGRRAVVVGRFLPVAQAVVPLLAGSAGMARRRLLAASAVGALLWSVLYVGAGFMVGDSAQESDAPIALVGGAGFAAVLVGSWLISRLASRVLGRMPENPDEPVSGMLAEVGE